MLAGIREILLISTPQDLPLFQRLLGDGSQWGLSLTYAEQPRPEGLAQAYIIGAPFVAGGGRRSSSATISFTVTDCRSFCGLPRDARGATIFAYHVTDPERYGVVEFDKAGHATRLEEKPKSPKSNWAVTGLYFYDERAPIYASKVKPSPRGELEITDLNMAYLRDGAMSVERMGRGYAWLDTGTPDSLVEAAEFIRILEKREGLRVACPEEIAYRAGWIDADQLSALAEPIKKSAYGAYLCRLLESEN